MTPAAMTASWADVRSYWDLEAMGERLERSYQRNPEGWQTRLALQADVASEKDAARRAAP